MYSKLISGRLLLMLPPNHKMQILIKFLCLNNVGFDGSPPLQNLTVWVVIVDEVSSVDVSPTGTRSAFRAQITIHERKNNSFLFCYKTNLCYHFKASGTNCVWTFPLNNRDIQWSVERGSKITNSRFFRIYTSTQKRVIGSRA